MIHRFVLALAMSASLSARADPPFHPGTYLSGSVGAGYLSVSEQQAGVTTTLSAMTVDLHGSTGVMISPHVAVYLRGGYDPSVTTLSLTMGGKSIDGASVSVTQLSFGPGLSYFWSASDAVSLAVLASRVDTSVNDKSSSTNWGWGVCAGGSKDWQVAPGWRIGLESELVFSTMSDSGMMGSTTATAIAWVVGARARH
jgi:hypothetical protein